MPTVCPHCHKLMSDQPRCPYCGGFVVEPANFRERLQMDAELRHSLRILLRYTILFPIIFSVAGISCVVLMQLLS